MKLYVANGSTSCRKVLATALYLDIPLEQELIAFYSHEFDGHAFARKNPNGMVPLLEDGDFSLWESTAIMQYLADTRPDSPLFSQEPKCRADISRWQYWALAHFGAAGDQLIWENVLKNLLEGGTPDPRRVEDGERDFLRFGAVLEQHLEGREFMVGEGVTLADFSVGAVLGYAESARLPWDDFTHVQRWYASLNGIDAWAATAPKH